MSKTPPPAGDAPALKNFYLETRLLCILMAFCHDVDIMGNITINVKEEFSKLEQAVKQRGIRINDVKTKYKASAREKVPVWTTKLYHTVKTNNKIKEYENSLKVAEGSILSGLYRPIKDIYNSTEPKPKQRKKSKIN